MATTRESVDGVADGVSQVVKLAFPQFLVALFVVKTRAPAKTVRGMKFLHSLQDCNSLLGDRLLQTTLQRFAPTSEPAIVPRLTPMAHVISTPLSFGRIPTTVYNMKRTSVSTLGKGSLMRAGLWRQVHCYGRMGRFPQSFMGRAVASRGSGQP